MAYILLTDETNNAASSQAVFFVYGGILPVDRLKQLHDYDFLREKFTRGMVFDDGRPDQPLSRIVLYASSCDGASHAASAADIVLGAFRYCVNERARLEVPATLLPKLAMMMWHRREGNVLYVRDLGLHFRPREVMTPDYRRDYDELVRHFEGLIRDSEGGA